MSLLPLQVRRYSIYNDNPFFKMPRVTPKLFLLSKGQYLDLRVD